MIDHLTFCPYRVESASNLVVEMEAMGYRVVDRWTLHDRSLRIPFHDQLAIESYQGLYFELEGEA